MEWYISEPVPTANARCETDRMQHSLKQHEPHKIGVRHFHPSLPGAAIEIISGRARHAVRHVGRTTYFIGSGQDCDLVLSDPRFAEVYAYLLVGNRGISIRHLGIGPDLLVNGRCVRRAMLCDGAEVVMGSYEFKIHTEPATEYFPDTCEAVREVNRLLDEVAQDKLPSPDGPQLSIHGGDWIADEESKIIAAADGISVGIPFPSSVPPLWQHFSWQHFAE